MSHQRLTMVEVLQFIVGGTVLWGLPRFFGVVILLVCVTSILGAFIRVIKR